MESAPAQREWAQEEGIIYVTGGEIVTNDALEPLYVEVE